MYAITEFLGNNAHSSTCMFDFLVLTFQGFNNTCIHAVLETIILLGETV